MPIPLQLKRKPWSTVSDLVFVWLWERGLLPYLVYDWDTLVRWACWRVYQSPYFFRILTKVVFCRKSLTHAILSSKIRTESSFRRAAGHAGRWARTHGARDPKEFCGADVEPSRVASTAHETNTVSPDSAKA